MGRRDIGTYALAVNGTSTGNAVNAAPVINTAVPFSVSAWVDMNSLAGTQTFASIDGSNVSGFALQYRADTGKFAFTRTGLRQRRRSGLSCRRPFCSVRGYLVQPHRRQ